MDFLQGLNPQQREAVTHVEGPLLILAGAGSGKTRVITHRIAHLIRTVGVPGPAILAVTFTNKAAGEMRDRVMHLVGVSDHRDAPLLSTFHSFCVRLLRRDGEPLADFRPGFTRNFTICDDDDQIAVVKQAYRALGLDEKFLPHRSALSIISGAKNRRELPEDMHRSAKDPKMSRLAVVFEQYENALRRANALDFDDLLLETARLLRCDEQTREYYNRRFEFVLIDEYQDTNRVQYDLIRLLTAAHQNVCVVGDEDQSIYSWRGADIRNILDFERDYPDTKVIRLEQNYRSTKTILQAASAVVANNTQRKGKWLWTDAGEGLPVTFYEGWDGENEALYIADTIDKILRRDHEDRVAVLYRTNSQSRQIEEALRRYSRRYVVVGGFSFYQRAEVKDIVAYLKAVISPQDSISLLRIINTPARGIGKTTVEQIEQYALERNLSVWDAIGQTLELHELPGRAEAALAAFKRMMEELGEIARGSKLHELLNAIIAKTGYGRMLEADTSPESESRRENLNELVNAAADADERGETAFDFLDHAALVAEADQVDEAASVSLLTVHNAKGLEFPVVFLAGMEEALFPHIRSIDSELGMEEERRLCYVGMTRARKRLFMTWARQRRRWGGGSPERTVPSRFLKEVPRELVETFGAGRQTPQVDLYAERHHVREVAKKNVYTGKTYNSLENIAQFFADRGVQPPRPPQVPAPPPPVVPPRAAPVSKVQPPKGQKGLRMGSVIQHPKYGRGTVLRREGEGEDAKLTISFPGYGLKKLVEKYAGLKTEE
jgi:DNA helicase-2/ATP-dependent DNA helicase PcrA